MSGWVGFERNAWGVILSQDENDRYSEHINSLVEVCRRSVDGPPVCVTGIIQEICLRTNGSNSRIYERFLTLVV